jgi:ATP-binding protein involved in chromosome partitioning
MSVWDTVRSAVNKTATPSPGSAEELLQSLRNLDSQLPVIVKESLGEIPWAYRLHAVEENSGKIRISFFGDNMNITQKSATESYLSQSLKKSFPNFQDLMVLFERKTPRPEAQAPQPPPTAKPSANEAPNPYNPQPIPGVKHIIAVASGKGGVGKSTVSTNLSVALAQLGHKVGILDADVYGPNIPMMFGLRNAEMHAENELVVPPARHGVKVMSMGFLAPEDAAIIWRGPMINKYLKQAFVDIAWGELDFLVIDLPPGTGDTQISLVQQLELTGAVIVTTPQNVALHDAQKAITMFERTNTLILGVVENMSGYVCPHCGNESELFGKGGGQTMADRIGTDFLGRIPLVGEVRERGDSGDPIVTNHDHPIRESFLSIARKVVETSELISSRV